MTPVYTEGERRLRAIVRAALSPGVWLVIGAQFIAQYALRQGLSAGDSSTDLVRALLLSFLLVGFAYLQTGAYHGLAQSKERLTLYAVVTPGATLFARFVWLFLKLGVLAVLVFNLVALVVMGSTGASPETIARQVAPSLPMWLAVIGLVFVYWLPLVFVTGDFRLFVTVRQAMRTVWQRLPQLGFLALLLLAPVALLMALPPATPEIVVLSLSVLASLLGWVVYIYCVEWLRDHPPRAIQTAG